MPEVKDVLSVLKTNYPLHFVGMEFHRSAGSISYIVTASGKRYFLKIIRPAFVDTAHSSIDIHLHLLDNGVPAPSIIHTKAGNPYVSVSQPDGVYLYVLYEYLAGGEPDIKKDALELGRLTGRFHQVMQNYPGKLVERSRLFFIDRYIRLLEKKGYAKASVFESYGLEMWDKVRHLKKGYCHGDLYIGNVLKAPDGKMYLLDFDTSCQAFPMYDVMMLCNRTDYFQFRQEEYDASKAALDCFLPGYLQFAPLEKVDLDSFFDLIAVYHFQLQATILEIHGLDCVDAAFFDKQLDWLNKWRKQCDSKARRR